MAPSPAAGKATGGAPKTPTKLGRKPQSSQTPKLGQAASSTPASGAKKPSTPSTSGAQKPDTSNAPSKPDTSDVSGKAEEATEGAKDTADKSAKDVSEKAEGAQQESSPVEMKDDEEEDDDDEGPLSKVSQEKDNLQEQAPQPVDDDDDAEDTAAGAQDTAEEAAEDAGDDAEDVADDATEKAGDTADDTADDATDDAQESGEKVAGDAQDSAGGVLNGAKGLAGKASGLAGKAAEDPSKAAGDAKDTAEETADDAKDTAGEATEDAQKVAGDAGDEAGDAAEDAQDAAGEAVEGAKDTAEETAEGAEDAAEDAAETAEDTAEGAEDTAEGAVDGVKDTAKDAQDTAEETAEGAKDTAEETAEDAEEGAEGAADGEVPAITDASQLPVDLSVLKGLEVGEDGTVNDAEGKPIGKLVEGDAEDLAGYEIGDEGEILDDDGDLVGRCELLPEEVQKQMADLKEKGELPEGAEDFVEGGLPDTDDVEDAAEDAEDAIEEPRLPGLHVLNGFTCDPTGIIYNDEGDAIGQVTDGDPSELMNATLNDNGEFIDEDGNVIGHAKVTEEAAQVYPDEIPDVEDELPGIEALQGRELNEAGEIVDDEGNVLGQLDEEGSLKDKLEAGEIQAEDLQVNEAGEVVDADGNVLGNVGLAEGAAEKLASKNVVPKYDIRILNGKKVSKKGKILDDDGEEIGELSEGELKDCAGKKVNEKGEVVDKDGNVIGKVSIVEGDAAAEATKDLLEELGELPEQQEEAADEAEEEAGEEEEQGESGPQYKLPGLETLEGLKINKKGKILDEEGDVIGELADGDLAACAGKKANDKGEVLDDEGNVIGRVKTVARELTEEEVAEGETGEESAEAAEAAAENAEENADDAQEAAEDAQEAAEDAQEAAEDAEDAGPELPPLSVLEGLTVNKSGKLVDSNGTVVGELVEGDAKKLSKSGITADAEGQFWDSKGHVIGRAQTVAVEDPDEEAAFAGLEGLIVVKDGYVEDENGNKVGIVVEGDAKRLIGRAVDEDGDILDKKGSVVGHADRWEEEEAPEEEAPEEVDLSFLQGKVLNKQGMVIGDEGVPVARLVEGNAKELAGKKLDDQGQIWNDSGKVIGRVELIPENERDEKPEGPFAGLQGLRVVADGKIADEDENIVGEITEGNPKRLVGLAVDEDGDIVDKYGNVKGHAEPLPEEEEQVIDNSILDGKVLNKSGFVIDDNQIPIGKLVEGNVKELAGRRCDENGLIHNDTGKTVGRCEVLPEDERQAKPEGPFGGLEGLHVNGDGNVEDENGNVVGVVVEGNAKRLVGLHVDEDGDILDKFGNKKGHAEPIEEEEEQVIDNSILDGKMLNKQGFVVNEEQIPIGKLVEGNVKELAGRRCDEQGQIHGDTGKVVGRCEVLPENERVAKPEGPFAGLEGLHVNKQGYVEDDNENVVGIVVEGNAKRLVGLPVDEDGDILDKFGNKKGHADPWEEEEVAPEDLSKLAGCTVNKAGNVVDNSGAVVGRVAEGDPSIMIGKKVDGEGQIWDNEGNVIGRAELVRGADNAEEGPFAGFEGLQINKEGEVYTPDGSIVGRVIEGDIKKLVAHAPDESGDILDKNGNVIGKAERWEPEEKERRVNPMSGRRVNREGEVRDDDGNIMGRLTAGDLQHCAGEDIDDNGNVVDQDGNKLGEVTLLENIVEEEEEVEEDLTEEQQIAEKMANICTQTLERIQPVCKQITEHMEAADRTPKEELDEDELVDKVKPLIEEGGRILQECNGSLRGLDPDGHIAANAKGHSESGEASPQEHRLAECLKELTTTVVTTIDNAKKKLNDMPHAKKKLNPLWGLLTQPLFQILAAVGLLLTGVLGLVGQLLNGLGLGGLVNGLLGGLGINKLLGGLGLGGLMGGDKKKKGGGLSGLPVIGGMLGSKK